MRKTQTLLLATTNAGKKDELLHFLGDLPFEFLTLHDLPKSVAAPEETGDTLEENAILKARYYGDAHHMLALADDTGLFIDAWNGWPGIKSARVADDSTARCASVLEKMHNIPKEKRQASFRAALCVYDPITKNIFMARGETPGEILAETGKRQGGFGYDPIFFVPECGKTYAEMTIVEKNAVSHRGRALNHMKYILQNQYGGKHIVVPVGIIIKNGQVLAAKRNDPHRKDFHEKWEFPGGRMDMGETLEENLLREIHEEVGMRVEVVDRLRHIAVEYQSGPGWAYQVYLLPYVCRWLGDDGNGSDAEVLEKRWVVPDEVSIMDLIGANDKMYAAILPDIKRLIQEKHL